MSEERIVCRLKDVLEVVKHPIDMRDEDDYMLASIRRRNGGMFDRETKKGKSILTKTLNKVIPGSFVISRMQVVHGACGMAPLDFGNRCISASYTSLIPREPQRIDIGYLDAYARTRQSYDAFLRASHGVHIEKMTFNLDDWLNGEIELPPLPEQKKIAEIISGIDDAIARSRHQMSKVKQARSIATRDLLQNGINRNSCSGVKDEGTQSDWQVVRGDEVLRLGSGSSPSEIHFCRNGNANYMKVDDFNNPQNHEYITTTKLSYDTVVNPRARPYPAGTIVIAKRGAAIEKNRVRILGGDTYMDTNLMAIRSSRHDPRFLAEYLAFLNLFNIADTTSVPQINNFHLQGLFLPVPEISEQLEIVKCISSFSGLLSKYSERIQKLEFLKSSVSIALLSGRKRVSV